MAKFKAGQTVLVARCPDDTPINWVDEMKVGEVLIVRHSYDDHCELSDGYYYGNDCLEPVPVNRFRKRPKPRNWSSTNRFKTTKNSEFKREKSMITFKKGDKVKILRNHTKWKSWVAPMDDWVGKTGIILRDVDKSENYVRVSNLDGTDNWNFPLASLENIKATDSPEQTKFVINEPLQDYERF